MKHCRCMMCVLMALVFCCQINSFAASQGEVSALRSANSYLEVMGFSYNGLIEQLEYDQYTHEEAVYAADNCGADWNENAVKSAEDYLEVMGFSYNGLIEQLEYDQYTHEEAVYAADVVFNGDAAVSTPELTMEPEQTATEPPEEMPVAVDVAISDSEATAEAMPNALFEPDESEEDPRFLIKGADGTYGYCNEKGEVVIPCQWYEAEPFDDGIARVRVEADEKSYGYINKAGELIVPYRSYIHNPRVQDDVQDGYVCYLRDGPDRRSGPYDICNAKGEIVYSVEEPCKFNGSFYNIFVSKDGVVWELEEGGVRFYSFATQEMKTLDNICEPKHFSEGLFSARQGSNENQVVFVNKDGEVVICLESSENIYVGSFHEGLVAVYDLACDAVGYIDQTGNCVIPYTWDWISDTYSVFSEGLAVVAENRNDPRGYINTAGEVTIPLQYESARPFKNGMAAVMNEDGFWGFINHNGEQVIDYTFNDVEDFCNGYALVMAGAYQYYIDREGNFAFSFDASQPISELPSKDELIAASNVEIQATPIPAKPQNLSGSDCERLALSYLKGVLKNPKSLQVHSTSSRKSGDSYLVAIDYSAMNGFGGYSRETFICMVDKNGRISAASSF